MPIAPPLNFPLWLSQNQHLLQPPVNNFCLYKGGDFIVMAVGGPNQRNDYHVNQTEEWFYQHKGGMLLRIVDDGVFRDIRIEEGEMFLLPGELLNHERPSANTPHNPVRYADTIGLVVERERPKDSIGKLAFLFPLSYLDLPDYRPPPSPSHAEPTIIYEESFHVTDLGTQLKPVINKWMDQEDLRKCKVCGLVADPK
ncbi:3-hydroxyanthranilate 3,4-dioxygenase 2 [Hypsizygus marmoreus]|uniref:3-hydroxyanthranilate 3,4-dioxygenase n=1 Tax=Hypsizygus marmoreus TaxID=39966 RepID=A0A369KIV6_HYPMA|nr:3-hydroxyanthranilate 3,4-dioxygenase 2 [Hypsizygus marmoreus]